MYDLHVHTTASDGLLTPQEVIDLAVQIGLKGMAITDHDTLNGLQPAIDYIRLKNIDLDFVPGIEINTDVEIGEVHILGYFIDPAGQNLRNRLEEIRCFRRERAIKMIERLAAIGLHISVEAVEGLARGDLIGRPHIAMALKQNGYVESLREAFDKYIAQGGPAYVPRYKFPPAEAVDLIHQAGGIAVLAHPGLIKDENTITDIIDLGIDGIEVYYPEHDDNQIKHYEKLAKGHGLLITGGSDFHGTDSMESHSPLGAAGLGDNLLLDIKQNMLKNK